MTDNFALLDLPEPHLRAMDFLLKRVPPTEFIWALIGSAGLRLQGVDVPVHDLDIQTDEKTIYLIQKQLSEFMITPVHLWETSLMRSLGGRAEILVIEFELLANITHRRPDGAWCGLTDFSYLIRLETHGLHVFVFPLEDELESYSAMGRTEKATLIRLSLKTPGSNPGPSLC